MQATVIVPTYREARTVADVVAGVRSAVARPHDVLVVDDSPDAATVEAVRAAHGDDPGVEAWHRQGDGLASAVLAGFDRAGGDCYVVLDGDGQHPPERVPDLVGAVADGADIAVGSRFVEGGAISDEWPLTRRVVSQGATWAVEWLAPPTRRLSDPMSGFFAVRGEVVNIARPRLRPTGFKILLELLARAPVREVAEVGYEFRERDDGESTLTPREYVRFARHAARVAVPARMEVNA